MKSLNVFSVLGACLITVLGWLAAVSFLQSQEGEGNEDPSRLPAWIEVGAAKIDITPDYPVLLAGYAGRTQESEGLDQRIWARAMAIGSGEGVAILVAVDNCGVPQPVVERIAKRVGNQLGVRRERFVVCSTHTHNAPNLNGYAPVIWAERANDEQLERMNRYTRSLEDQIVALAKQALENRRDCQIAWGQGRVVFGGNRRVLNEEGRWTGFGFQKDGPVDHSMPLLVARDREGELVATWANYACHCTTLGMRNHIGGDWAGFANVAVEAAYPGVIPLTTIGCGADVGPQPTGSEELARRHGEALAAEVARLLERQRQLTPLSDPPAASMREVRLPFDTLPDRSHWESKKTESGFDGVRARRQLARLDRGETLLTHLPYQITTWTFGNHLAIVFLPGEVVVDYAVRLKRELDWKRMWINGWANDVPCYIPSKRILAEGGYEADSSQIYYDRPTRFAPDVEEIIVGAVKSMLGQAFAAPVEAQPSPYHRHPDAGAEPHF